MAKRAHLSEDVVTQVLVASRRRCCLCFFLLNKRDMCKGNIAHLNQRADDGRLENLVWLCFDHHDDFDSTTSQSKGLREREVRTYRDRLIAELRDTAMPPSAETANAAHEVAADLDAEAWPRRHPMWHFPLWLKANRSELFAYTAPGADGICAIERVDLPDGRIVIACIEMPGNPGKSITNAAEHIFAQVCERFELPHDRVVWLENYESFGPAEWRDVRFSANPDQELEEPDWTTMTPEMWAALRLSPRKRLAATSAGELKSKLRKHFAWPPATLALGLDRD